MMRLKLFIVAFGIIISTKAQQVVEDTTDAGYQEIGFNVVGVLAQFSRLNSASVSQLPYTVFYNGYFNKTFGLRMGAGISTMYQEEGVNKQKYPAVDKNNLIDFRFGFTSNYSRTKHVVLNAFMDLVVERGTYESITSYTSQTYPNPIVTKYEKNTSTLKALGFQIGTGVKYEFNNQLGIYMELPFTYIRVKQKVDNISKETGLTDVKYNTDSKYYNSYITLPASIYLVLKF